MFVELSLDNTQLKWTRNILRRVAEREINRSKISITNLNNFLWVLVKAFLNFVKQTPLGLSKTFEDPQNCANGNFPTIITKGVSARRIQRQLCGCVLKRKEISSMSPFISHRMSLDLVHLCVSFLVMLFVVFSHFSTDCSSFHLSKEHATNLPRAVLGKIDSESLAERHDV